VDAPGKELLSKLQTCFPDFGLVAEDLGTITPDVLELRDEFSLPGMLILQFAFDGSEDNPYLLKNHHKNSLVYTATHDNDTTLSWYNSLPPETKEYVDHYVKYSKEKMPWALIRVVFDSIANLAIIPMQDLLGLGEGHRMNTPGTIENNWQWRYQSDQFTDEIKNKVSEMLCNSNRAIRPSVYYSSTQVMQPNSNL
jgi:4-alpha-glucanotransferase